MSSNINWNSKYYISINHHTFLTSSSLQPFKSIKSIPLNIHSHSPNNRSLLEIYKPFRERWRNQSRRASWWWKGRPKWTTRDGSPTWHPRSSAWGYSPQLLGWRWELLHHSLGLTFPRRQCLPYLSRLCHSGREGGVNNRYTKVFHYVHHSQDFYAPLRGGRIIKNR